VAPDNLQEQLTKYLTDVHAIEQQALAQMHVAPGLAGDEQIARAFTLHLAETEQHESLIRGRLDARDASPSKLKDITGLVTGHGFGLFAAFQPDTPGKLVVHAYSYEHMEEGAYDMLGMVATRADDEATLNTAREIEAQEHAMGDRLEAVFDRVVDLVVGDRAGEDLDKQRDSYLTDAHAIEVQATKLLESGQELVDAPQLSAVLREHLNETREHEQLITACLEDRGAGTSMIKDAALRLGALNLGGFFAAQPDTPMKLAVFAYAFEHLEIASYELLRRVAERVGDTGAVELAQRISRQETDAARRIRSHFSEALDATLAQRGLD
jgi:ferritin-like metal-binding protein YciE